MTKQGKIRDKIRWMVGMAIFSAIVVVLQLLGSFIKIGPVSICIVLLPIAIGAAVYGPGAGAFLGAVCGAVILCQPDTVFFFDISPIGTVLTVMGKGIFSGWISGSVYRFLSRRSAYLGAVAAAAVCPIVNTGLFFLGCCIFFRQGIAEICGGDAINYVITVMIGINFLAELGVNLVLSPSIPNILRAKR